MFYYYGFSEFVIGLLLRFGGLKIGLDWYLNQRLHISQAGFQRIHPIRNMDTKSFFDLSFVEYRISRTNNRTRKLVTMAGLNVTLRMARQSGNYLREIVPRADPFVAEMIDAILAVTALRLFLYIVVQYGTDGQCQIVGIGRCTGLIKYHLQLGLRRRQIQHRLYEVLTKLAIQPGGSKDDIITPCSQNILFWSAHKHRSVCLSDPLDRVCYRDPRQRHNRWRYVSTDRLPPS